MEVITKKLVNNTIDYWKTNNNQIMDSQKKYNEEAMNYCLPRLEKLRDSLEN